MLDYRTASLNTVDRALCDYAVKLTLNPAAMGPEDTDALRAVGLSDEQISNANFVASYFNFINRVADGLGVDLEPEMQGRAPFPAWKP